jgi:uncharacterized protein (TIGR03085 family)
VEYFVHHEDVRRGQPDWEPRELDRGLADQLWQQLARVRLLLRKAPVGVEFARDDAPAGASGGDGAAGPVRITAKARAPMVTVTGPPAELMMWAFGRTRAARVRLAGSDPDVAALASDRWRA